MSAEFVTHIVQSTPWKWSCFNTPIYKTFWLAQGKAPLLGFSFHAVFAYVNEPTSHSASLGSPVGVLSLSLHARHPFFQLASSRQLEQSKAEAELQRTARNWNADHTKFTIVSLGKSELKPYKWQWGEGMNLRHLQCRGLRPPFITTWYSSPLFKLCC